MWDGSSGKQKWKWLNWVEFSIVGSRKDHFRDFHMTISPSKPQLHHLQCGRITSNILEVETLFRKIEAEARGREATIVLPNSLHAHPLGSLMHDG